MGYDNLIQNEYLSRKVNGDRAQDLLNIGQRTCPKINCIFVDAQKTSESDDVSEAKKSAETAQTVAAWLQVGAAGVSMGTSVVDLIKSFKSDDTKKDGATPEAETPKSALDMLKDADKSGNAADISAAIAKGQEESTALGAEIETLTATMKGAESLEAEANKKVEELKANIELSESDLGKMEDSVKGANSSEGLTKTMNAELAKVQKKILAPDGKTMIDNPDYQSSLDAIKAKYEPKIEGAKITEEEIKKLKEKIKKLKEDKQTAIDMAKKQKEIKEQAKEDIDNKQKQKDKIDKKVEELTAKLAQIKAVEDAAKAEAAAREAEPAKLAGEDLKKAEDAKGKAVEAQTAATGARDLAKQQAAEAEAALKQEKIDETKAKLDAAKKQVAVAEEQAKAAEEEAAKAKAAAEDAADLLETAKKSKPAEAPAAEEAAKKASEAADAATSSAAIARQVATEARRAFNEVKGLLDAYEMSRRRDAK